MGTAAGHVHARRLFLAGAFGLALWLGATFLWHVTYRQGISLAVILLLDQDFPALLGSLLLLALAAPWAEGKGFTLPKPTAGIVVPLILLLGMAAWAGHYALFQDYAISRDEEVARFAAAYMREGLFARPIPVEWEPYRRAIMPEFFSPFGAADYWTAAYLPVNSAIQAIFWELGDPNLAGPVLLMAGLFALWRVALHLMPDRPDAVWVTVLLGFSSSQLWVTAMTPYAMTGHFALNMVWLALVLRGGVIGHLSAGVVALIAAGLHQWHFPPIFIAPFILWMLLARRWGVAAFHAFTLVAIVIVWAKLWPGFLLHALGAPADVRPSAGVADKVGSLFQRLGDRWQPLVNISRYVAWNNILMVPLAVLGMAAMRWRSMIRGQEIALPLALGCLAGCMLALAQGYGWGFRYAHGFIGPFCLLAGLAWARFRPEGALRPLFIGLAITALASGYLVWRTHMFVAPYAASHKLIDSSEADVVLVDPRGGLYVTDLVRGRNGVPGKPMVMNLGMLTLDQVDRLCQSYVVQLFDRSEFRPLGVPLARWNLGSMDALRAHMKEAGCDKPVQPPLPDTFEDALNIADNAM
ncbi:MFS transporter [Sphingobium sp. HBC34]|uniref:MFS transporter n=1 Tax=Sphingobium cyanobacteriorum TaxID=3063954 RepID=A0ABT8ZTA7_9SPHN|nr:MFS transporter [Sphingobium sp. HBC34]MDO7837338.1 MFS transporter [Sphingobium sp. HBC34]